MHGNGGYGAAARGLAALRPWHLCRAGSPLPAAARSRSNKYKKAHLCHKTKMRLARLVYQPLQPCSSQSPATAGSTIWVGSILPSAVRGASVWPNSTGFTLGVS